MTSGPTTRPDDASERILREGEQDIARRAKSKAPKALQTQTNGVSVTPVTADEEIDLDDPYAPPIPEGEYLATYITTERGHYKGTARLFVHFQITEGECAGRVLIRFYNAQRGPRLARSHEMWGDFVRLTGRKPPTQGFKPSWLLAGCEVRVRVTTVHERTEDGRRIPMAECEHYSKIDRILAITAGSPPAIRGSRDGVNRRKTRTRPRPLTPTSTRT